MTIKIPDHKTPGGTWCRSSGCDSLSGICWMCEPDSAADPDAPAGTLQFRRQETVSWHTARRPPTPAERETAELGPAGQFWLSFDGEPYSGVSRSPLYLDRLARVVQPRKRKE